MERLVAEECDRGDWVGDWNDDVLTQEPRSRTSGFCLLAINCQNTGDNYRLCRRPISAKFVHSGVYVYMHVYLVCQ